MDQTVDGDVTQDTHTERDVDATTRVPLVRHQHTSGAGSKAQEPLPPEAASHQVVVGDIPLEPPGFRSRADLLAKLDRTEARVLVIYPATGLLGPGTTQLAAAYARAKLAAGWRLVAWVNAAETGSLQTGLAAVAEATGLTDGGSGRDIADAGQAVRHLLETDGDRCLLVFDDVADPEALRPFVPADGTAQILITSTRQPTANLATAVPVDVFSADEALSFLTERTGLDDEAGAAAVAAVLGHLPLALALAAPVIRGQRHGYARYLDRLQTIPTEAFLTGDDGQPYPRGVARAVPLSLAAIRVADKTGMCTRVIEIMAVLSAAGVRRELLHVAGRAGVLASGGHRVEAALVDRALEWLSDRSLLTFSLDGQTVMMHRLVAQVVRDGLVRRQRLGAVCWVAASVLEAHAIAVAGSPDRPAVSGIPQQVMALLDHTAERAGEADEELAEVLLRLRFIALYHLIELGGKAPQAIAVGESLTADLERLLGPGHPDTLNSRNSLAAAYLAAGRVADAIPLFEQTLVVLQRQLGADHPDTLTLQNNLAAAYQDAGRVAEAIQLYEQNLAVRERLQGPDDLQYPELPRQPRRRLSGGGPGRRRDCAVRADLGRSAASAGTRSSRYPDLTEEPGQGLPSRGPGRRRDTTRADLGRPATSAADPITPIPRPHGRTSPPPTATPVGPPRRSRQSSRPWPLGRVRHLPMPPRKCLLQACVGLPPIRPGGCFLSASVGLPPIRPGDCFLTAASARLPNGPTIHPLVGRRTRHP